MNTISHITTWLKGHPIVVLLLILVAVFSILSDSFLSTQNLVNILIQASALTIVATGMTFVLITAGIDLSVGSIMFLAGVIASLFVVNGGSVWLAIPIVLIIGILYGIFHALFIIKLKIIPFIVTLASLYIGRGLGLFLSRTRAINLPDSILNIGSSKLLGIPLPVIIMILVVAVFHIILTYTPFGRQVYAIGHNREKSVKAGIQVDFILLLVYIICAMCATIGGLIAIAQLGAVSPSFGFQYEFMAIAAAVLGGTSLFGGQGNILPGTLIGAVIIQMIQNGLVILNADPYVYPLVTGAIIFLIVFTDSQRHYYRSWIFNSPKDKS